MGAVGCRFEKHGSTQRVEKDSTDDSVWDIWVVWLNRYKPVEIGMD